MNFKSVTINLLLTTLSGGILMQTLEAQAASITFGAWNFKPATVTTNSSFATGQGNATPMTLKALAEATATANPLSWAPRAARTVVSLSNFFTVTAETGEKNGDKVKGVLSGRLEGVLGGSVEDVSVPGGFYASLVGASVDAGFASWNSQVNPLVGNDLGSVPIIVNVPINGEGILTIGEQYQFNMSLDVTALAGGYAQAFSNFSGNGQGFTVDIQTEPVPEPLTMLASATALGFGALLKRQNSKNQKKS
jgi:hypothetical protein